MGGLEQHLLAVQVLLDKVFPVEASQTLQTRLAVAAAALEDLVIIAATLALALEDRGIGQQ